MAKLIQIQEDGSETILAIEKSPFIVGRSDAGDLDIDHPSVSGRHAVLQRAEDGYHLADLGSTNGTEVNGREISSHLLEDGDQVQFGDIVYRFELDPDDLQSAPSALPIVTQPPQLPVPARSNLPAYPPPQQPMPYAPYDAPRGPGILPILALLAAVTAVGFPVALMLGVLAFVQMARHGGTRQDRLLTYWALGLGTFWLMVAVAGGSFLGYRSHSGRRAAATDDEVSTNEAAVIRSLKGLACAQRYARAVEIKDVDGDGAGEYLGPGELAEAGSVFFDPALSDGSAYGYRFFMQDLSEDRFLAVAEPRVYGRTGRRTFAIDHTGRLRAADGEGKRYSEMSERIPVVAGEPGAFYEKDDEIAKDIINFTRGLSVTGEDLERVDRILRRVREKFTLTEVGQELLGVSETTDLFLQEKRAQVLYDEAAVHLEEGRVRSAIGSYKKILQSHGDYSRYEEVDRAVQELEAQVLDEQERAAKEMMAEADALERAGQQEEARALYLKIERLYPDTDTAMRISDLKGNMDQQVREKEAEELFFSLMEIDPRQDFTAVLSLADQLTRNYDDTALYGANAGAIEGQARKARAEKWRASTQADMASRRTRGALARLEAAARENPDINYDLRDLFIELYRDVGARLVEEGDDREALRVHLALERLLQDAPDAGEVDGDLLAELHYRVGIAELDLNRHETAHWHLSKAAWKYREDPRFQLRLGVANLYTGEYGPAIGAFDRSIELEGTEELPLFYRAYAMLRQVATLEPDIARIFEGAEGYSPQLDSTTHAVASATSRTRPPPPTDLNVELEYNYVEASQLVTECLALVGELQDAMILFEEQEGEGRGQGKDRVTAEQIKKFTRLSEFRNRVSTVRAQTRAHEEAQREFMAVLQAARRRLGHAAGDLQRAAELDPLQSSVLGDVYRDILRKRNLLEDANRALRAGHARELRILTDTIFCGTALMDQLQKGLDRGLSINKLLRDTLMRAGDRSDFDVGLMALEQALEVDIEFDDVLDVAEGGVGDAAP